MDRIGIKRRADAAFYDIRFVVTPHQVAAIPVSADDILTTRAPNPFENPPADHRPPGKPVIEIRFANTIVVEGDRSTDPSRRH